MDILLLYHRLPYPPNKGEKTRACQQITHLSRNHRLWVACFIDDEQDCCHVDAVRALCHRFEAVPLNRKLALSRGGFNLLRGRTLTEGFYGHGGMWRVVQEWTAHKFFDVALAFSSSMAAYVEELPAGRRVLDLVDFDSHKWADYAGKHHWPVSMMLRTESRRLAQREIELIQRFDLVLVVNERECRRVQAPELRAKIVGFPTLMDLQHYAHLGTVHDDKVLGYVGTMDYAPNAEAVLWFAEHIWPGVSASHPDAEWWIVGRRPVREIRRLAELHNVKVTGAVEDVRPYLARMRVVVSPIQTDIGIPTKVLEAMAAGRAVVTTALGHQAIGAVPDRHYVLADEQHAFKGAVDALLQDRARCADLGRQAVEFIRERYDVPLHMPRFEQLLLGAEQKVAL